MPTEFPTPDQSPQDILSPPGAHQSKPQRVLACQLCQQRKVRCDRKFPCGNCTKSGAQCISTGLAPRQRRRRFPERALLERLRHYEGLLKRNNIAFEPLHPENAEHDKPRSNRTDSNVGFEQTSPGGHELPYHTKEDEPPTAKNFWHAMNRKPRNDPYYFVEHTNEQDTEEDDDDSDASSYLLREKDIKNIWDTLYDANDELLFCSLDLSIDLVSLHPNQIHTFQLWQKYLENVDPLLKVTHTPSLQARIINAASDVSNISPALEALMFSIYSMAVFSMSEADCTQQFGASRQDLLQKFHLGTRRALLNAGFLKTTDRDCLTALHLYLISVKPNCDPRSLSTLLGAAARIAQRMGINDEATNSKHTVLEAEMRRRLWWSLVLFDARMAEMTEFKSSLLLPIWHCKLPLNVNDFDLRSESKVPPQVHSTTSEALFAVVRSELGDFIRYSDYHLDFINPALKAVARTDASKPDNFDALENYMEERYLRHCESGNHLHFMTKWWVRGQIAKARFINNLAECSSAKGPRAETHRDSGLVYALRMLECDTKTVTSKAITGFRWMIYLNFPFPAYVHIVQELRKRPVGEHAVRAWEIMNENCTARFMEHDNLENHMAKRALPFFKIFAGVVVAAWVVREAAMAQAGTPEMPPAIITALRSRMAQLESKDNFFQDQTGLGANESDMTIQPALDSSSGLNLDQDMINATLDPFSAMHMQPPINMEVNHWGWPTMNWNTMGGSAW